VAINRVMETFLDMVRAGKCRVIPGTVGRRATSPGVPAADDSPCPTPGGTSHPTGDTAASKTAAADGSGSSSGCNQQGQHGAHDAATGPQTMTLDAADTATTNPGSGAWRPGWTRKKDRRAAAARGRVRAAQGRVAAAASTSSSGVPAHDAEMAKPGRSPGANSTAPPECSMSEDFPECSAGSGTAGAAENCTSPTCPHAVRTASPAGISPTPAGRAIATRSQAIAAADLAQEPVETTARALGVSSRTVENYRAKPAHQALMLELAERHRANLEDGYHRAVISALADLEAGEWQARDRARVWLTEQVQRSDVARGLVAQAGGLVPAPGVDKPTLTEVVMVLRQYQGPG